VAQVADAGNAARATAETVAARSYGRLVAFLAVRTHDVAAAEDALSDAFAAALAEWPRSGCPANPEAWLLTVARRRLVDGVRRRQVGEAVLGELQQLAEHVVDAPDEAPIPDQRLALLFACAHPAIDAAVRAPLMLQTVLGLDAKRIAAAFLTSPAAMGKRLGRAKQKIREAGVPLRVPERAELPARLDAVLAAIYAAFTDGWCGGDASRHELAEEAIFLARIVVELLPDDAEAPGLLACMLYAHARRAARRSAGGDYVPLHAQDVARWDSAMIGEAEALLRHASTLRRIGRFQLEAALQSAHVERRRHGRDNATAILQLHDALAMLAPSPVAAINRALALADVHGAAAGLGALPDPRIDARIAGYQPYWATRADLLARSGATAEARAAYETAIALETDEAVRRFLRGRRAAPGT
jgi:RNA polymerase sigma-70 factor (ECF subfamily)